jgi:hypothetical protein
MSQSDYIQYKKTGIRLRDLSSEPSVIDSDLYTSFVNYNLENKVINTKITYNQLIPANKQIIFGSERNVTNCPTFILCNNTNKRINRMPILRTQATPRPTRKYVKDPVNYRYKYRIKCKCKNTTCVCKPICNTCFTTPIVSPKAYTI